MSGQSGSARGDDTRSQLSHLSQTVEALRGALAHLVRQQTLNERARVPAPLNSVGSTSAAAGPSHSLVRDTGLYSVCAVAGRRCVPIPLSGHVCGWCELGNRYGLAFARTLNSLPVSFVIT